jgi:hypothetical protein
MTAQGNDAITEADSVKPKNILSNMCQNWVHNPKPYWIINKWQYLNRYRCRWLRRWSRDMLEVQLCLYTLGRRLTSDSTYDRPHIRPLTYLLTELSPSWEAANCATNQEIPHNFKEPEGSSPCWQEPSSILSQFDPVPTIPSYLSNIVYPPTSWSS